MIIGHKRQLNRIKYPIHLDIGGEEIKRVHDVQYLGVSVDESLSWTVKYKKLKSKIKSGLSSILYSGVETGGLGAATPTFLQCSIK